MATTPALLSIDEYLHTSYHPDVDFVDGEIEERNVGEYAHGKTQGFLSFQFGANQDEWATDAVVEQRIRVHATRVRVCDVAVLRADTPLEEVTATPPLICIEVLSPEDRIPRVTRVLADYRAMGVPNVWLIDPYKRVAYTYDASGLHPADTTALTVPGTPIHVDLTPAFAQLDRKAARS